MTGPAGYLEVYESSRRSMFGRPYYRWRRIQGGAVREISPKYYHRAWTAHRGALRAFPGLEVRHLPPPPHA